MEDVEPSQGLSFPQGGTWLANISGRGWQESDPPIQETPASSVPAEVSDRPLVGQAQVSPVSSDEIKEDVDPGAGLYQPRQDPQAKEPTRRILAGILVGILTLLVVVGCIGWLRDGDNTERMQNFGLIFAPVVTLVGTMLAFYFSSDDK